MNSTSGSNLWSWAYSYPSWSGWVILVLITMIILMISFTFAFSFRDQHDNTLIPIFVFCIGMTCCLLIVAIVPIDVFIVSHIEYPGTEILSVLILYYTLFVFLMGLIFIVIPFTYNYYKPDLSARSKSHFCDAFFLMLVGFVVIGAIIVIATSVSANKDRYDYHVVGMMMSCTALLCVVPYFYFMAFGMTLFPFGLIFHHTVATVDVPNNNDIVERIRAMNSRFMLVGKKMNKQERYEYEQLERELKLKDIEVGQFENQKSFTDTLLFRVIKILSGFLFLVISWLFVVCVFLSQLDRTLYSSCGFACGFRQTHVTKIYNPIDLLLTYSSILFPIDVFVYFGVLISIIFLSTLTGLSMLSTGMFHKFRYRSTVPQGLISTIFVFIAVFYMFFFNATSVIPQYSRYGSQVFNTTSEGWKLCTIEETTPQCIQTRVSVLMDYALSEPFVAHLFYWANWFFIIFYCVGGLYTILNGEKLSFVSEHYISFLNLEEDPMRERFDAFLDNSMDKSMDRSIDKSF